MSGLVCVRESKFITVCVISQTKDLSRNEAVGVLLSHKGHRARDLRPILSLLTNISMVTFFSHFLKQVYVYNGFICMRPTPLIIRLFGHRTRLHGKHFPERDTRKRNTPMFCGALWICGGPLWGSVIRD